MLGGGDAVGATVKRHRSSCSWSRRAGIAAAAPPRRSSSADPATRSSCASVHRDASWSLGRSDADRRPAEHRSSGASPWPRFLGPSSERSPRCVGRPSSSPPARRLRVAAPPRRLRRPHPRRVSGPARGGSVLGRGGGDARWASSCSTPRWGARPRRVSASCWGRSRAWPPPPRIADRPSASGLELYTVNQLLAMHLRTGAGPVQAVRALVDRGEGAVIEELPDVLDARCGIPSPRVPTGRRAHARAGGGAHLQAVRHRRRTGRRPRRRPAGAERRPPRRPARGDPQDRRARAAMLVPTIAVLAPVMLLFIAAPLPSIVFGAGDARQRRSPRSRARPARPATRGATTIGGPLDYFVPPPSALVIRSLARARRGRRDDHRRAARATRRWASPPSSRSGECSRSSAWT